MTEKRRAPLEVLERLAEAAAEYTRQMRSDDVEDPDFGPVDRAYDAYLAATAPLRTRAEVDADIVAEARAAFRDGHPHIPILVAAMHRLCSEPTTDEPKESNEARHERMNMAGIGKMFDTLGRKWARKPNATTDHDADLRDPELCSCEEVEALRERLAAIRKVCESFTCSVCAVDVLAILGPP